MKRYLFCICLLFTVCAVIQSKERAIKYPPFIAWSSNSIEISKIEISDSATVVHITPFYRPQQQIRITSQCFLKDNNGETYPLRSGIGIKADTDYWIPESEGAEFQLIFPSLPQSVTSIDFSEGDNVQGGLKIWGIQLQNSKLPELLLPVMEQTTSTDKNFVVPPLSYGKATLKGKILDFRPGMMENLYISLSEPGKGFTEGPVTKIHPDGSFALAVPVMGITPCFVYIQDRHIRFFLAPGETSEVVINMRELCRQQSKFHKNDKPFEQVAFFSGTLSNVAKELNENSIQLNVLSDFNTLARELPGTDINIYNVYMLNRKVETEKAIKATTFCDLTKQILLMGNDICTAQSIAKAADIMTQIAIKRDQITESEATNYHAQLKYRLPENNLDALKSFSNINSPMALLSDEFTEAIYCFRGMKDGLSKLWNTRQGTLFDTAKASELYEKIKNSKPLTEFDASKLSSLPEAYRTAIEKENTKLLRTLEANKKKGKANINEVGEVNDKELFASILSPFRDRVILVDFWATWCGPCRVAEKGIKSLKKELSNKDIVYLYITGETSPLDTWKSMIPALHGEHFRVTAAQWEYLMESLQIKAVPTYIIIDQNGKMKYKETGIPDMGKMKEKLLNQFTTD